MVKITAKEKLIALFKDMNWHTTGEVFMVGGFGGLRRLQELRLSILAGKYPSYENVEKRRIAKSPQYEYRFVKRGTFIYLPLFEDKTVTIQLDDKISKGGFNKLPKKPRRQVRSKKDAMDRESKIVERRQELEARQPAINVFSRGGRRI